MAEPIITDGWTTRCFDVLVDEILFFCNSCFGHVSIRSINDVNRPNEKKLISKQWNSLNWCVTLFAYCNVTRNVRMNELADQTFGSVWAAFPLHHRRRPARQRCGSCENRSVSHSWSAGVWGFAGRSIFRFEGICTDCNRKTRPRSPQGSPSARVEFPCRISTIREWSRCEPWYFCLRRALFSMWK